MSNQIKNPEVNRVACALTLTYVESSLLVHLRGSCLIRKEENFVIHGTMRHTDAFHVIFGVLFCDHGPNHVLSELWYI